MLVRKPSRLGHLAKKNGNEQMCNTGLNHPIFAKYEKKGYFTKKATSVGGV